MPDTNGQFDLSPSSYVKLIQCVFTQIVSPMQSRDGKMIPLYIRFNDDMASNQRLVFLIRSSLPHTMRDEFAALTYPRPNWTIRFAETVPEDACFVDPLTGKNNCLVSREAKIALRKFGYVTYAAETLSRAERNTFYRGLNACSWELGDPTGENPFLLEIAFRCFWNDKERKFCELGKKEIRDTDRFPNARLIDLLTNVIRSEVVDSEKLDWLTERVLYEAIHRRMVLTHELHTALLEGRKRRKKIYNKSISWDFLRPEPSAEATPAPIVAAPTAPTVPAPASVPEPEVPQTVEPTDMDPAQNRDSKSDWNRENVEPHADDADESTPPAPVSANPVTVAAGELPKAVAEAIREKVKYWLKPKKMVPEAVDISDAVQDLLNTPEAERNEEIRELSDMKNTELSEQCKSREILKQYFSNMSDCAIKHNDWNMLISAADTWKKNVAPYGDTVTNDIRRRLLEAVTALSAQTIIPTVDGAVDILNHQYRKLLQNLSLTEQEQEAVVEETKVFYYSKLRWDEDTFDFNRSCEYRKMLPTFSQKAQRIYADFADLAAEFNTTSRFEYLRRIYSFFFGNEKSYYLIVDAATGSMMMERMCKYLVGVYQDNVTRDYQLWMKLAAFEGDGKLFQQILDLFSVIDQDGQNSILEIERQLPKFIQDCRNIIVEKRSQEMLSMLSIPVMHHCSEHDSMETPVPLDLWLTIGNAYKGFHNMFELFALIRKGKIPAIFHLPPKTVISQSKMIQDYSIRKLAVQYGNQYRWAGPVEQAIGTWLILYEKNTSDIPNNERIVRGIQVKAKKKEERELDRRMKADPDVSSSHSQDQPKGAEADTSDLRHAGKKRKTGKRPDLPLIRGRRGKRKK